MPPNTTYSGWGGQLHSPERLITLLYFLCFLMLAEAYVRYSFLNPEQRIKAERSAIIACTHAKKLYQENDPAIFNASLVVGLAASNTMDFATPDEAMNGIKNLFDNGVPLTSCDSPKIS